MPCETCITSRNNKIRTGKVARRPTGNYSYAMRLDNGRWTVLGSVDVMKLTPLKRDRYVGERRVHVGDIGDYLYALAGLGMLTEDDAQAFRDWRRDTYEAQIDATRLLDLADEAFAIGAKVVDKSGNEVQSRRVARKTIRAVFTPPVPVPRMPPIEHEVRYTAEALRNDDALTGAGLGKKPDSDHGLD